MSTIEKEVVVEVPVSTAYNQWTQFEEFPKFMEGVREVRQLEDDRLFWRAEAGGEEKEWYARIVKQEPDSVISWQSESGIEGGGEVRFQPAEDDCTKVTLCVSYEPEGAKETVGDKLGFLSRQVGSDLDRFKEFIEERGSETGAWRGRIPGTPSAKLVAGDHDPARGRF